MNSSHVHDTSGFLPAVEIGDVLIPTYFLVSSFAFIVAMVFFVRRAERESLARNRALDISLVIMITGFIGARLFHVVFEEPSHYAEDLSRILEVWRGGFVWYGGALVSAAATLGFLRWKRDPVYVWLDVLAPVIALGYAIGRLSCFLAGCCYGAVCVLPNGSTAQLMLRYPTQAYAIVSELLILVFLLWVEHRGRMKWAWAKVSGQIFFVWLGLHGLSRLVMEAFRADPRGPSFAGLSLSSAISVALIVVSLSFIVKRSRP